MMIKNNELNSLYVHIPFCLRICNYCDFCKYFYHEKISLNYINTIVKEINNLGEKKFKTIYIGGGTPSCLSINELNLLLKSLLKHLKLNHEFTIEVNIDSINEEKLRLFKKYKVNRISVGVQTFNEKILKKLNIFHTKSEIINKINLINKYFKNYNIDLIYGIPFSNINILKDDLKNVVSLKPSHISIYSLQIEKNTYFGSHNFKEMSDENLKVQYDLICNFLNENKYKQYEVSNFCKNNKVSKHNLNYWNNGHYLGIGVSAASYINNFRYKNTTSLIKYEKGEKVEETEVLNKIDEMEYFLMLGFRKTKGINYKFFKKKYKIDLLKVDTIKMLQKEHILLLNKNNIYVNSKYFYVQDEILLKIFKNLALFY